MAPEGAYTRMYKHVLIATTEIGDGVILALQQAINGYF